MQDTAARVGRLPGEERFAIYVVIESNTGSLFKYLVKQGWTFFGEDTRRLWRGDVCACVYDVGHESDRIVINTAANDSALGIERVRFVWVARPSNKCDETAGIAGKLQRCSCARNATTDD
jgi:hypothetical protein